MIKQIMGAVALSPFRISILLKQLQGVCAEINDVSVRFVHFVELSRALNADEQVILQGLLHYGSKEVVKPVTGLAYFVVPRFGTLSPWSSKATDIAHNCELTTVKRIERGLYYVVASRETLTPMQQQAIQTRLHDPLTQTIIADNQPDFIPLFARHAPQPLRTIDLQTHGKKALSNINQALGLALSDDEIDYLFAYYQTSRRTPTDVELMMFAQANSEHCRHKIFNAHWIINGATQTHSLFSMIKRTYEHHSEGVLSAYKDNAAVIQGHVANRLFPDPITHQYQHQTLETGIMIKVETHNHPTAISPYSGAATGSGGEIRDEGATGIGAKPKAGLTGFSVSHLRIPEWPQSWIDDFPTPKRMQNALSIMLEAPIGGAAFNNEFGRPNIAGYFRSFEYADPTQPNKRYGYHKPIMIAGGMGSIQMQHVQKKLIHEGALLIVIGGPAMLIGLGGGAASSIVAGQSQEALDFASVQRDNAEMQRRCQELIDRCCAFLDRNPIISIHDVGAGGLSNALPELIHDSDCGGQFQLRNIPNAELSMSPLAIWCNEAQERYVLAIDKQQLTLFEALATRERCPFAVVGQATTEQRLTVHDAHFATKPIDLPMSVLFGKTPKLQRQVERKAKTLKPLDFSGITLSGLAKKVLAHPTVASKSFLITIGDRSVGGLIARDQMVGPWQVPVSDVAVTLTDYQSTMGEAMAIGEAILNIAAARIDKLSDIKLSANWMAAAQDPEQQVALFDTVQAVALELCPALNLTIPVGKDSLSMQTQWQVGETAYEVTSPLSLIISAFAPVSEVRQTLTPQLRTDQGKTALVLVDLGDKKNRLGGSIAAQVLNQLGDQTPDLDEPKKLHAFFKALQILNEKNVLLAYHDRSDGGLFVTVVEMAFAGHCGVNLELDVLQHTSLINLLFNEELGAVLQVKVDDIHAVMDVMRAAHLIDNCHIIGTLNNDDTINISFEDRVVFAEKRTDCQKIWSECSYHMQRLRDNPDCAHQEFSLIDSDNPGLSWDLTYTLNNRIPNVTANAKPRVAILREQGVNGQQEMAAAFTRAGFTCVDVHMSDVLANRIDLQSFH
jgi:phosphoribosylformylglycinamidine synthase